MAEEFRGVKAADLYELQLISDCRLSPDGAQAVFCVETVDPKSEKKPKHLWAAFVNGRQPRQLTFGGQCDSRPRWSPDSKWIAFLSDRAVEEQQQIYLLPVHGGEARRLTDLKGEFESLEWSPDGRQLLCQFRRKDQEEIEREKDETKMELGRVARHFTRVHFKRDGVGYLPQERWHIWTVDAESGEGRPLTDGEVYDELAPHWSPDGSQIVFLSNRRPEPDLDYEVIDLYVIPAAGGEMRRVEAPAGQKQLPTFSPDGRWLAYFGREGRGDWWKNTSLWVVPADGSGPARDLTGHLDIDVGNETLGDVADRPTVRPIWSPDSRRITFQVTRHGNTLLQSISLDGETLDPVVETTGIAGSFSADSSGQKIACCLTTPSDPGQIWLKDLDSGDFRQLTRFNEALFVETTLGEVEERWFKGPDDNDLQGWIVRPPGFDPAEKYPAIIEIHGGPWLQYGNVFMHEFHYLAAQGYVVAFCNPRGGQGYGEEHSRAIENNWGMADYADIMAWTDTVAALPYVDEERMGVAGGSYGGYMTGWIIGHTDRFKAAVAQRVVSNLVSMWGSSDYNWGFQQAFGGRPPWENLENYWRQSPIAYIGNAKTPTLVIHSEKDMRCDLEQGLQLFVALKYLGVPTELVLFPDEFHGLSRGGRTDRRVVRLEHMKRWFDCHLKD